MTSEKFEVQEVEVMTPEAIKYGDGGGEIWPAVTDSEHTVSYEVRNNYVAMELCEFMNKQEDEISYWKHKVGSLLFILSKFEDKEKVRELIKEVEEEGYSICDK